MSPIVQWLFRVLILAAVLASVLPERAIAEEAGSPEPDDGWFDLSDFLDKKYGFLPVLVPITEPAVGYGAAGGLMFLSSPIGQAKAGYGRPDITFVGGMATENDTSGFFGGDIRHWLDDRLQTRAFVVDASINLDFFGIGDGAVLGDQSLQYELEPRGVGLEARYRIGGSRWWTGLDYQFATVGVRFREPAGTPDLPAFDSETNIGGLQPSLTLDSRDNIFTPTRGNYLELTAGFYGDALGGDQEFQSYSLLGMYYRPLSSNVYLGLRGDLSTTHGDVPFYMRPFISLRGVPMLRYQGEAAGSVEAELRWQFWKRFSLVGFGGVGGAWNDFERFDDSTSAVAGGLGMRYEIARRYGIHVGLDIAVGPEDVVIYVQVGSAWARP